MCGTAEAANREGQEGNGGDLREGGMVREWEGRREGRKGKENVATPGKGFQYSGFSPSAASVTLSPTLGPHAPC